MNNTLRPHSSWSAERNPKAWAQLVVRSYANTTNMLIAGRRFHITDDTLYGSAEEENVESSVFIDELASLLNGFGAHVSVDARMTGEHRDRLPSVDMQSTVELDGDDDSAQVWWAHVHIRVVHSDSDIAQGTFAAPWARNNEATRNGSIFIHAPIAGHMRVFDANGRELFSPHDPNKDDSYGHARIEWARARMPVTEQSVSELAQSGLLAGKKIGLSLVLEPKTAALALMLHEAGAEVSVFGHADETRDDVAEVLRDTGVQVYAESDADAEREERLAQAFLMGGLNILLDDGSHLIRMAHSDGAGGRAQGALRAMIGAAEETTSGIRPLRKFDLRIPVIASNDARSKTLFDNAYATGQSCLTTILDLMDPYCQGIDMWNKVVVVVGYGDVGKGFARYAKACGARVRVIELDPVRQLQARMDGYESASDIHWNVSDADMVVSATGEPSTIPFSAMKQMRSGTVIAVAGGVVGEVEWKEAVEAGWEMADIPEYRDCQVLQVNDSSARRSSSLDRSGTSASLPGDFSGPQHGKWLILLGRGTCINCTAGEGNPIEVMDMSFGVQVSALAHLLKYQGTLTPGLHMLPKDADDMVSFRALEALS